MRLDPLISERIIETYFVFYEIRREDFVLSRLDRAEEPFHHGKPVRSLVTSGLKSEVVTTIDTGLTRTFADFLAVLGEKLSNTKKLSDSAIYFMEYLKSGVFKKSKSVTNPQLNKIYRTHPKIKGSLEKAQGTSKIFGPSKAPIVAVLHYYFSKKNSKMADKFIMDLATGEALRKGDPAHTIRENWKNILDDAKEKGMTHANLLAEVLIWGWNSLRQNRRPTKIILQCQKGKLSKIE